MAIPEEGCAKMRRESGTTRKRREDRDSSVSKKNSLNNTT